MKASAMTRSFALSVTVVISAFAVYSFTAHGMDGNEGKKTPMRAEPIPNLKPALPTARIHNMLVSRHAPMQMYAATPSGLYGSADAGATWKRLSIAGDNEEVFAVAAHPIESSTVFGGRRDGVWLSHDGGESWMPLPYPAGKPVTPLAIAPAPNQPNTIYIATARDGVYRSVDGGYRWAEINQGLPESRAGGRVEEIRTLVVHPLDANAAYVALPTDGVYLTTDAGKNWVPVNEGLPVSFLNGAYRPILEFDSSDPKRLYLVFGERIHSHLVRNRIYMASANTDKWIPVEAELPSNEPILAVRVDGAQRTARLWGPSAVWQVPLTEHPK